MENEHTNGKKPFYLTATRREGIKSPLSLDTLGAAWVFGFLFDNVYQKTF